MSHPWRVGRRLQDDRPSGEFIIFFIILTVGKEILRTFFQIAGWTEDQLQAQGVALVERGAKKIRVYGRTHALQQCPQLRYFSNVTT